VTREGVPSMFSTITIQGRVAPRSGSSSWREGVPPFVVCHTLDRHWDA